MSAGRIWPAEWRDYRDLRTGVTVRQLTDYKGHSHHLYFTNPGWYDGGRRLICASDRENRTNLFSLDLSNGEIIQLTDLVPPDSPRLRPHFQQACLNPVREEIYFCYNDRLMALDPRSLHSHSLWEITRGFRPTILSCTADGKHVCLSILEDLSERLGVDYTRTDVGFWETWAAKPQSRIVRIATDGDGVEVLREEQAWIGHVNTSPTQANLLTFCHEGPWDKVDNRIWGMDTSTGKVWTIRPREEKEMVGHEYWHADGVTLGYHGTWADGRSFIGRIKYDNTGRTEASFSAKTGHIHSSDSLLIVGDAGDAVRLWRWDGAEFIGPRMLCEHDSSSHIQEVHVHPRFTPDGKGVLFTSDLSGYGNLYLAELPEFDSLPAVSTKREFSMTRAGLL